jgi:hypothetical protein
VHVAIVGLTNHKPQELIDQLDSCEEQLEQAQLQVMTSHSVTTVATSQSFTALWHRIQPTCCCDAQAVQRLGR